MNEKILIFKSGLIKQIALPQSYKLF